MKKIIIISGAISFLGELNTSLTATKIWEALPLEGITTTWGNEIYFEIPIEIAQDPEARAEVEVGTLGY
jgi:hypothetical protein